MNREVTRLIALGAPILLIAAVAAWLGGQGAFGPRYATPSSTPGASSGGTSPQEPFLVASDSPMIAAPGASVTVVEFLDFECEACGAAFPIVKRILSEYEGRLTYVVRDFPNHNNSVLAASAAYAADEQGQYWEMYDLLFERQTSWAERQESQASVFLGFAKELGLDMTKFQTDLESGKYVDRIRRDFQAAASLGVDATPTFFFNGAKVVGVIPYEEMKRRIEDAIAAGS